MNWVAGEIARAEVLEQKRHSAKWAVGNRAASLVECALIALIDDGVELRIQALDSIDRGLHEFHRFRVAAPHHFCLRGCVEFREFIHDAGSSGACDVESVELRMFVLPWACFFELRRQPDDRDLVGLTTDDLHRER